jgi:holo-[acyl-carrier protein] synthase
MEKILGIGIDICKTQRIANILVKPYSYKFINRVLHKNEQEKPITAEYLSSRWAAKEALVKATGNKLLVFSDIQVIYNAIGQPQFKFYSSALEALSFKIFLLSISHEKEYSVAVVISILNPTAQH